MGKQTFEPASQAVPSKCSTQRQCHQHRCHAECVCPEDDGPFDHARGGERCPDERHEDGKGAAERADRVGGPEPDHRRRPPAPGNGERPPGAEIDGTTGHPRHRGHYHQCPDGEPRPRDRAGELGDPVSDGYPDDGEHSEEAGRDEKTHQETLRSARRGARKDVLLRSDVEGQEGRQQREPARVHTRKRTGNQGESEGQLLSPHGRTHVSPPSRLTYTDASGTSSTAANRRSGSCGLNSTIDAPWGISSGSQISPPSILSAADPRVVTIMWSVSFSSQLTHIAPCTPPSDSQVRPPSVLSTAPPPMSGASRCSSFEGSTWMRPIKAPPTSSLRASQDFPSSVDANVPTPARPAYMTSPPAPSAWTSVDGNPSFRCSKVLPPSVDTLSPGCPPTRMASSVNAHPIASAPLRLSTTSHVSPPSVEIETPW